VVVVVVVVVVEVVVTGGSIVVDTDSIGVATVGFSSLAEFSFVTSSSFFPASCSFIGIGVSDIIGVGGFADVVVLCTSDDESPVVSAVADIIQTL